MHEIPSYSKRGIKVQKHALSMVSMPCPGGSQTTFKTFVCEMSHKVGLPWALLKHKLAKMLKLRLNSTEVL